MRPLPLRLVAILVGAILVAGVVAIVTHDNAHKKLNAAAPATTTSSSSTTSSTSPPAVTGPTTTAPVPNALARQFDQIKAQVASLRGLDWLAPLDVSVANDADFVKALKVVNDRDAHPDRMNGDGETDKLLQLIPNSLNYKQAVDDLLAGQVLGFYDPKTKRLLVRQSGTSLSPTDRMTIAHEMDHALTDQHFSFGATTDALDKADKQEEGGGYTSLLEGDAVLLQTLWAQRYLTAKERSQLGGGGSAAVLARTPRFLLDSLRFPYTSGLAFVQGRWSAGGWGAVNAVYGRPPVSTQQILHPELYLASKGWTAPAFPDLAAATGCASLRTGEVGEFGMTEILDEQLDEKTSSTASTGWNSDRFATVRCGGASGPRGFADRWLTSNGSQLAAALSSWAAEWSHGSNPGADGRFSGTSGAGRLVRANDHVDLVLADDTATVDKVSAALGD